MKTSYRLPAEWSAQSCVMIAWPHGETDWADHLPAVERVYLEISKAVTRHQDLIIVCHDEALRSAVRLRLDGAGVDLERVHLAVAPVNDTWTRDYAPLTTLQGDHARLMNFGFNGWGGKYSADLDDRVTRRLVENGLFGATPCVDTGLVLEGGAVETDGEGTLLATLSSTFTETRNPGTGLSGLEQRLSDCLGIERFLWLQHGHLSGDDTDGHIDTLARFADSDTIVYVTALPEDPDAAGLAAMEAELKKFRTRDGKPYRLVPLPPLCPQTGENGNRLPGSYANFLIINGAVLLPVYGDPSDQTAIDCLQGCFPQREIIPIDCQPLIRQNGSLHCVTMQFPAAVTTLFKA